MPTDDLRVLQSQRNDVLQRLTEAGLDPREFRWEHVEGSVNPGVLLDRLVHSATGFYFEFDSADATDPEYHRAIFSPGSTALTERVFTQTWMNQLSAVRAWASYLRRELGAPPLWDQFTQGEPMLSVPLESANDSPFSPEEQGAIESKLDEVLEYLARELSPGSLPTVTAQIEQLRADAMTSGRVSWLQQTVGVMFTLVWGGLMAPDQARTVLQMIGQAFQKLIGGG